MASGYTRAVQTGEITEFQDFALRCARGVVANVWMRDDPTDAPIKEYAPSPHHAEQIERARTQIRRLRRMSINEATEAAHAEYEDAVAEDKKQRTEVAEQRERYDAMLAEVIAWKPPTPDHVGLKEFMVKQLTESIEWDCSTQHLDENPPRLRSGMDWLQEQIDYWSDELERAKKRRSEETESAESRNEWNRQLRESLK